MRRRWSLQARLLLVAALTSLAALVFASFAIGAVLERFVVRGLDQTLDTQIAVLRRAVTADGRLNRAKVVELPGFDDPAAGWLWQVRGPAGLSRSAGAMLVEDEREEHHRHREHDEDRPYPGEGRTASGERVHLRRLAMTLANGDAVEITAAAPRGLVERPLLQAEGSLLLSLVLLGLGLAAATLIQLRYGLGPVRALQAAVARVRTGATVQLPTDQPRELRPLAEEVNALIEQNRAGLEHARRHVANLAHGLKTPLATLSVRLAREQASAETRALVDELDTRIAHHLRRARAAAPSVGQRAHAPTAEVIADLVDAMKHVHADRALTFALDLDAGDVAVDRRDLEELLGNLIDNAARHAASQVRISAHAQDATTSILIEDDGSGLELDEIAHALQAGVRLDERENGYGFGLAIAQELTDLYGGRLVLGRAAIGGLSASLALPR